ncbi:MAG: hypothetical protein LBR45_01770 [Bacteroidales bacterium]|jgi:hypothetical protein|nr:hypothetical protein [Bacteroidales bacterium]
MKKVFIIIIGLLTVVNIAYAKKRGTQSFNLWLGAGYSNIMHFGIDNVKPIGGAGGIMGLGYGYEKGYFLLQTGVELDYKGSMSKVNDFSIQVGEIIDENTGLPIPIGTTITSEMKPVAVGGFYDTEGEQFAMLYQFSKYRDYYHIGYLNIPLLFGGKFGNFYFLLGGKFGINIFAQAKTSALHSTIACYPQFIDIFDDMPDHFIVKDYPSSDNTSFSRKLNYNISALLEVGYNFNNTRIAFFVDYGLLNINKSYISIENTSGNFVYIPAANSAETTGSVGSRASGMEGAVDPNIIRHNSILSSNKASSSKVNSFMAGIKITFLFKKNRDNYLFDCPAYGVPWKKKVERNTFNRERHRY